MSQVELAGVTKRFGSYEALRGIDLTIADGEFMVFVGPSGCGKSTLLRLICGLDAPTSGTIRFDGRDMRGIAPAQRQLAMVFQSYALYPHMSVADNMGFALRMSGVPKEERAARVARAAEILQITRLLERRPKELSGGQRQRVAIGRAIVREPSLFLFDEPLSNLDAELRVDMRYELAELHRRLGTTMIYVTHDQVEAMTMADRIAVLRDGRVEQVGTPTELYERPVNRFVAGFIGSPRMNLLAASVADVQSRAVGIRLPGADELLRLEVASGHGLSVGEAVELGIRPEHIDLSGGGFQLPVKVSFCEYVGGSSLVHANDHPAGRLLIRSTDKRAPIIGEAINVGLRESDCYLFSSQGVRV